MTSSAAETVVVVVVVTSSGSSDNHMLVKYLNSFYNYIFKNTIEKNNSTKIMFKYTCM